MDLFIILIFLLQLINLAFTFLTLRRVEKEGEDYYSALKFAEKGLKEYMKKEVRNYLDSKINVMGMGLEAEVNIALTKWKNKNAEDRVNRSAISDDDLRYIESKLSKKEGSDLQDNAKNG